jgi:membrane-associated protein
MFNVESWLKSGGIFLLAAIVFAESGLFIGFFLPGDTLLFIAGFLSSEAGGNILPALPITAGVVFLAAVAGDQVGYLFGRRVGPELFDRPQSRLFKPSHVVRAHEFFEEKGSKAIVIARFVPIVRTFTPIVAGVAKMNYRTFITYNLIGGALWGIGVTTLGYFLGEIEFIKNNLEYAAIVIFFVSVAPVLLEIRKARRGH